MAKKPITVKLEKDMLEDVDNECQGLGCNRTDFVTEAVQEKLDGKSKQQEPKPKEPQKISVDGIVNDDTIVRKPTVTSATLIDADGKETELTKGSDGAFRPKTEEPKEVQIPTLTFIPEPILKKLPDPATMRYIDGQWRPYATRYKV